MSGKHVMLSYQWNNQEMVKKVYELLSAKGFNMWMDIEGGMHNNIYESMAKGVENADAVVCFMSQEYQDSTNCKRELEYSFDQNVPVIPAMTVKDWKAKSWLGLLTAGMLWIDFRDPKTIAVSVESLAKELVYKSGDIVIKKPERAPSARAASARAASARAAPPPLLKRNPGRAFRHKLTNKFLAESGEVKFHEASGSRSTLVLRETAEDTSFWVEERQSDGNYHFKNYSSNGFLGYDPNGDYIYTKGQAFGAENWKLISDEVSEGGERAVVIYADFGKKYLAIINGKLTGMSSRTDDCVWLVE